MRWPWQEYERYVDDRYKLRPGADGRPWCVVRQWREFSTDADCYMLEAAVLVYGPLPTKGQAERWAQERAAEGSETMWTLTPVPLADPHAAHCGECFGVGCDKCGGTGTRRPAPNTRPVDP